MAFAHAQMMLYRPFLHYVSQTCKSKTVDQRAFACASACVSVSRNIVHITMEMKRQGLLIGAYWFSMYTTFFAILSLVFYALENHDTTTSNEVLRDAMEGKEVLAQLAKRSMAADRCTETLKVSRASSALPGSIRRMTLTCQNIFEQLPERLKRGRMAANRKRRQDSPAIPPMQKPVVCKTESDSDTKPRRASTFPEALQNPLTKRSSFPHSLPLSQQHLSHLSLDSPYAASPTLSTHDFFDTTPSLTPTSTFASTFNFTVPHHTPQQAPSHSFPATPITNSFLDPAGLNVPLPDMSAMMFPSADPFAYPNQPMTTFENSGFPFKDTTAATNATANGPNSSFSYRPRSSGSAGDVQGIFGSIAGLGNGAVRPVSANGASGSNSGGGGGSITGVNGGVNGGAAGVGLADNDVQLFGPMPMYLMQGAQHAANPALGLQGADAGADAAGGQSGSNGANGVGGFEGSGMNLDDLFSGEEWANTFLDQGLGLGGLGMGAFGGGGGAQAQGVGMGGWR